MNFNNLDLNLLVVFNAIFDEGSITKASEKLNLSQSAVSNALNRLRYSMKDDLFFRSGDRMQPTPAALEFVGPIKKALELIDGTLTREGFNPAESEKRFVFCTPDVAASKVAAKVVQTLQEKAPKIKITNIALQNGVLERLKNHDIDFILAADPHMVQEMDSPVGQRFDEYFDSFEVYRDTYRCVARKGHPLIKNNKISFENFLAADHVFISIDGISNSPVDVTLAKMGRKRNKMVSVNYYQSAIEIVRETDCIISLSSNVSALVNNKDEFDVVPLPFKSDEFSVKMIWNKRSTDDPANAWMRGVLFGVKDDVFL